VLVIVTKPFFQCAVCNAISSLYLYSYQCATNRRSYHKSWVNWLRQQDRCLHLLTYRQLARWAHQFTKMEIMLMIICPPDRKVIYRQICNAAKAPPQQSRSACTCYNSLPFSVVSDKYYTVLYSIVQVASCMQFFHVCTYTVNANMTDQHRRSAQTCNAATACIDAVLTTHCRMLWQMQMWLQTNNTVARAAHGSGASRAVVQAADA